MAAIRHSAVMTALPRPPAEGFNTVEQVPRCHSRQGLKHISAAVTFAVYKHPPIRVLVSDLLQELQRQVHVGLGGLGEIGCGQMQLRDAQPPVLPLGPAALPAHVDHAADPLLVEEGDVAGQRQRAD